MKNPKRHYADDAEVGRIVQGFESCEIKPSDFDHQAHLATAVWYLRQSPLVEARRRLGVNLRRFLKHHGIQGYNETVTLFWLKLIGKEIEKMGRTRPVYEIANHVSESVGDSLIIYDYYTKERLASDEARSRWVEPDLKRLDRD